MARRGQPSGEVWVGLRSGQGRRGPPLLLAYKLPHYRPHHTMHDSAIVHVLPPCTGEHVSAEVEDYCVLFVPRHRYVSEACAM